MSPNHTDRLVDALIDMLPILIVLFTLFAFAVASVVTDAMVRAIAIVYAAPGCAP